MDREFTQLLNAQLRSGRFPIPMDAVWIRRGLTLGASSSRVGFEEMLVIGQPSLSPSPRRPK